MLGLSHVARRSEIQSFLLTKTSGQRCNRLSLSGLLHSLFRDPGHVMNAMQLSHAMLQAVDKICRTQPTDKSVGNGWQSF